MVALTQPSVKPVHILVAGGNYAGLNAIKYLYTHLLAPKDYDGSEQAPPNQNVRITLVDRRDGFVHFIGMTRGLTEPDFGEKLWVPYSSVPWLSHPSITVRNGIIKEVTANNVKIADSEEEISFDYLIMALGQSRGTPIGVSASTKGEFVKELLKHHHDIKNSKSVVVVGGGAVGIEMAADVKCDFPEKDVTLIHSRALPIPGPFKDEFRQETVRILKEDIGVNVILGERVIKEIPLSVSTDTAKDPCDTLSELISEVKFSETRSVNNHEDILPELISTVKYNIELTTTNQSNIKADWVINCTGTKSKASVVNLPSSTDEPIFSQNGIRVNKNMQIDDPKYSHIFAIGDVCDRTVMKLAGVAMYGGYIAAKNLSILVKQDEESKVELEDFPEFPSKLLLLMGKDNFLFQMGDEIWERERTQQFVYEDMGLEGCINALSLKEFPKLE
ncbi:hypothetical protein K7432_013854 [Basidiobolus ranarum]|uniref:FAD/NAD(P)-binding domain-containing protein n=1 Tax=Basidiobolus ranarum TaxID=34480 RepID=A0ABR2VRA6_9FUNG